MKSFRIAWRRSDAISPDYLDELVGMKIHARFRSRRLLWMEENQVEVVSSELTAAIDKVLQIAQQVHRHRQ